MLCVSHFVCAVSIVGQEVVQSEVEEPEQVGSGGRFTYTAAAFRLDVFLIADQFAGRRDRCG